MGVEEFLRNWERMEADPTDGVPNLVHFIILCDHELRDPLNGASMAAFLMERTGGLTPEHQKNLYAIRQCLTEIMKLVDVIFGLSDDQMQKKLSLFHHIEAAFRERANPPEWVWEAYRKLPRLKLFYLVHRIYMEGEDSVRKASEALQVYHFKKLREEGLAKSNVSLSKHIRELEPLFKNILSKGYVSLFYRPKEGRPLRFTDDAQKAWDWTDNFLRKHLVPDWFGFSRLTPKSEEEQHPGV